MLFIGRFLGNDVRAQSVHSNLVSLTIVLLIDVVACNAHGMVGQHRLGIDPTFLQTLFLCTEKDKQHLRSLEKYIQSRNAAVFPPLVHNKVDGEDCFPVRFASQDSHMMGVLDEIQEKCAQNQADKRSEYEKMRAEYDRLMCSYNTGKCSCHWVPRQSRKNGGYTVVCRRCSDGNTARSSEM